MEYCNGGELFDQIVKAKKFTEKKAANIMSQIVSAVKHLHSLGICHRDLKPENFLLANKREDGEIKLIDFGLSKRYHEKEQHMHTVVGTPYYVAPEVLTGDYTLMCDVWSLGIIMYILLCGYPPFEGESNRQIFDRILNKKVEFEDQDWRGVSKSAKNLIHSMLDKNPNDRPKID